MKEKNIFKKSPKKFASNVFIVYLCIVIERISD